MIVTVRTWRLGAIGVCEEEDGVVMRSWASEIFVELSDRFTQNDSALTLERCESCSDPSNQSLHSESALEDLQGAQLLGVAL